MKKIVRTSVSILLAAGMIYSLSSCTLFSSIRKRVEEANNTTLAATPEENEVVSRFNSLLKNSAERAEKINEKTAKILCSYIGNHMAPCRKDISPLEKSVLL